MPWLGKKTNQAVNNNHRDSDNTMRSGSTGRSSMASLRSGSRQTMSTGGGSTSSQSKKPENMRTHKSVLVGRLVFVFVLMVVAAVLGFLSYRLMREAETDLAEERFDSIAERALRIAQVTLEEKKLTTDSLAFVAAAENPNAEAWPNVYVEGFEEISTSLRLVTEGQGIAFCPIVQPGGEEQRSFEEFAYNLFYNIRNMDNATAGVSMFGRGVFSFDYSGNHEYEDRRYHDTTAYTWFDSPNKILVPFIQSDLGFHTALMLNVHFEKERATRIDEIIECSKQRADVANHDTLEECGTITNLMWSPTNHDVDPGPAGIMIVPIYPKFDNTTLTGFIVAKTIMHDMLKHGFANDVNGLLAVLRTDQNKSHTYEIIAGEAHYMGEGDLHEPNKVYHYQSAHINPQYFSKNSPKYYLDLYSTEEFMQDYSTTNPKWACIGAVAIIVFTSILFGAYDFFVRREFSSKKGLLESKRQFVRFVSHEVRTPLNTVCMGLSLMQDDFARCLGMKKSSGASTRSGASSSHDNEQVEDWMQLSAQIQRNAEAAVSVLNDLLNYDKIQMGTLTLELSIIPIWTTLHKTVAEFQIASLEKKVKLAMDFSPLFSGSKFFQAKEDPELSSSPKHLPDNKKNLKIVADNIRIAQVLRNLISNGLKFSKENGTLTVRVSHLEDEQPKRRLRNPKQEEEQVETIALSEHEHVSLIRQGMVVIEVIDNGFGMTPDQIKTVFKDGTQFNANKLQAGGGSGLGLNIAKGIATQHGGSLKCHSAGLDQGTTFTLSVPLYKAPEGAEDTCKEESMSEAAASDISDFHIAELDILVVDDSATNRKLCMRLLEKQGHTCKGACDGVEAVAMAKAAIDRQEPFDCILMDYEMPNMNGPEACKRIREMGCWSYVVGVTGNVMGEDVARFRECGANWVLPKPFRLEALEQKWVEDGVGPRKQLPDHSNRFLVEPGDELGPDESARIPGGTSSQHTRGLR